MAEKAIESGQPIPENILSQSAIDKEYVWQKGIKNIATGVGISLFGLFTTEFLIAVGLIIICWGAGQCVIARTSPNREKPFREDETHNNIVEKQNFDTEA